VARASRSPTTAPASLSRSRSRTGHLRAQWGKLLPGVWFYDRGSSPPRRARARSPIWTARRGSSGTGVPIEQLAESSTYLEVAYLLLNGELPRRSVRDLGTGDHPAHVHPRERAQAIPRGLHYDAHRWHAGIGGGRLSTFYLDAKDIFDVDSRNKQIIRLIAKMPTLAAAAHRFSVGMPFVYPDNSLPSRPTSSP